MQKIPLSFPFALALLVVLWGTIFFPPIRLFAFAPFLAIVYTRRTFLSSLWIAGLSGLILDLLSSEMRLGAYATIYVLLTFFLYHQKRHFFDEKPLALSFFTALISVSGSLLHLLFLMLLYERKQFELTQVATELIFMPLLDALYAFLWFTCPMKLYQHVQRVGLRNLFVKKHE